MDKPQAIADIIAAALPLAAFDGWNQHMLEQAAVAAGYKRSDIIRLFPDGAIDAADAFLKSADDAMLEALKDYPLATMKIRERIAAAIRVKLTLLAPQREAVRKAVALRALPLYAHRAMRGLYDTVDAIWYAAGDTSTDFNFYTKRLLLAGVYSSALLYWLNDRSEGFADSWAFLDRRIDNVMKIEKAKQRLKRWMGNQAA